MNVRFVICIGFLNCAAETISLWCDLTSIAHNPTVRAVIKNNEGECAVCCVQMRGRMMTLERYGLLAALGDIG